MRRLQIKRESRGIRKHDGAKICYSAKTYEAVELQDKRSLHRAKQKGANGGGTFAYPERDRCLGTNGLRDPSPQSQGMKYYYCTYQQHHTMVSNTVGAGQ